MTGPYTIEKTEREYAISRTFDAPRERVWQVWTKPEHLQHWWGPKGWTLPVCEVDLRPGGTWHYCMRGPNGEDAWGKAVYREIEPPARLVYVDFFSDAEGNMVAGLPQMLTTVEFVEDGGQTIVTARSQFATAEDLQAVIDMGMEQGLLETWDRLADYLGEM